MKSLRITVKAFKSCWSILTRHVLLILFPLVAFILNIALFIVVAIPAYHYFVQPVICHQKIVWPHWYFWILVLIVIMVIRVISLTFNGAATIYLIAHQNDQVCSMRRALFKSMACFWKLLQWSLFSYTFGWMLIIFEDQLTWLHQLIQKKIQGSVEVATIFLPVTIFLSSGHFIAAMKKSVQIHQAKWSGRDVLKVNFEMILLLVRIPLYIVLGFVAFKFSDPWIRYSSIGLFLVAEFLLQELGQIIRLILLSSLYSYAVTDVPPKGFSQEQMDNIFIC